MPKQFFRLRYGKKQRILSLHDLEIPWKRPAHLLFQKGFMVRLFPAGFYFWQGLSLQELRFKNGRVLYLEGTWRLSLGAHNTDIQYAQTFNL